MFDIKNLPTDPGCYLFKDKSGRIIYGGKAKNLRKRVKSYVQKNDLDAKTQSLIKHAESVEYIATDNEVEAFILENTLVKKYQPKYNIDLKDAKSYAFIQLTDEEFPRVLLARKKTGKGKFYGPFVSAQERNYILLHQYDLDLLLCDVDQLLYRKHYDDVHQPYEESEATGTALYAC